MQCLVTKLKESAANDNLLKLGEFVLKFEKSEDENVTKRYIDISSNQDAIIEIKGDAHFIDSATNKNIGTKINIVKNTGTKRIYVSNNACEVHVTGKYGLSTLGFDNTCIHGRLSFTSGMSNLGTVNFGKSNISGKLLEIKYLKKLVLLTMRSDEISGSLSEISNLTKIRTLNLESSAIYGNISDLLEMQELADCSLKKAYIQGDLSTMPDSIAFFSNQRGTSTLEWKGERSSNAKIIALESVRLGDDVDRMLINQAKCVAAPLKENAWYSQIHVYGNRTSASDEAVETLKNKGYKIVVNDVTL